MRAESELRVAFLSGSDNASARLAVESVCQLPGVVPVALLLDTEQVGVWRRFKNLRKNIRRNGWTYLPFRIAKSLRAITDKLADSFYGLLLDGVRGERVVVATCHLEQGLGPHRRLEMNVKLDLRIHRWSS